MSDVCERHRKQLATMRAGLQGRGFYRALAALEVVREVEKGTRKDGETPRLHHQLSVGRLVSTLLPHFLHPEETLTAAFLHDIVEDHGQDWSWERILDEFGPMVADAVWALSKKTAGLHKTPDHYFDQLGRCPIGSIVKLADRAHNLQTMQGAFTPVKQRAYVNEVQTWFFPMIRAARRRFPAQYPAYENLKILLRCQVGLLDRILVAEQKAAGGDTP